MKFVVIVWLMIWGWELVIVWIPCEVQEMLFVLYAISTWAAFDEVLEIVNVDFFTAEVPLTSQEVFWVAVKFAEVQSTVCVLVKYRYEAFEKSFCIVVAAYLQVIYCPEVRFLYIELSTWPAATLTVVMYS